MSVDGVILDLLARCHGYTAFAEDGPVGTVETPLFPTGSDTPEYVVVQMHGPTDRRPLISAALVEHVDPQRQIVYVRTTVGVIADLPDHLPLAFGRS